MSLLWVTSSPKDDSASKSKTFGKMLVDRLVKNNIIHRDTSTIPHLTGQDNQQQLIDEVLECETLVLSLPMWNYSFPSSIKAWIDHVTASGKTFHYDAEQNKVIGHCKAKNVYIVVTCGTSVSEKSERDFITPYLTYMFSYLGMGNVRVVWINNVYNDENENEKFEKAYKK